MGSYGGTITDWISVAFIVGLFVFLCNTSSRLNNHNGLSLALKLIVAALVCVIWIFINPVLKVYLVGCLYIALLFLIWCAEKQPVRRYTGSRQIILVGVGIALVLALSPTTISRITINLSSLPVPGKFLLHSDPEASRQHRVSRGYPFHHLNPLSVNLSADNPTLNQPMPWLEFQTRRDTIFPIDSIQYRFIYVTVHQLSKQGLHGLELSDRSDEVTLDKVDTGIHINNIGALESAWIQLPSPDQPSMQILARVIVLKLVIWILICCAFWIWKPRIRQEP